MELKFDLLSAQHVKDTRSYAEETVSAHNIEFYVIHIDKQHRTP